MPRPRLHLWPLLPRPTLTSTPTAPRRRASAVAGLLRSPSPAVPRARRHCLHRRVSSGPRLRLRRPRLASASGQTSPPPRLPTSAFRPAAPRAPGDTAVGPCSSPPRRRHRPSEPRLRPAARRGPGDAAAGPCSVGAPLRLHRASPPAPATPPASHLRLWPRSPTGTRCAGPRSALRRRSVLVAPPPRRSSQRAPPPPRNAAGARRHHRRPVPTHRHRSVLVAPSPAGPRVPRGGGCAGREVAGPQMSKATGAACCDKLSLSPVFSPLQVGYFSWLSGCDHLRGAIVPALTTSPKATSPSSSATIKIRPVATTGFIISATSIP